MYRIPIIKDTDEERLRTAIAEKGYTVNPWTGNSKLRYTFLTRGSIVVGSLEFEGRLYPKSNPKSKKIIPPVTITAKINPIHFGRDLAEFLAEFELD